MIIQSDASICKTFKIGGGWVKHFFWCGNTWLNVCVKFVYTNSVLKLNSLMIAWKIGNNGKCIT